MTEALIVTNLITLVLLGMALRANRRWARAYRSRGHRNRSRP